MNTSKSNLEPVFDFNTNESNVLIHQSQAEMCIGKNSYVGNGEVRLELLPSANIYYYGFFQDVPTKEALEAKIGQTEISSFSISGRQVIGFKIGIGGDATTQEYNVKWCPKSEPINGVGDESTQMKRVVFHLFNFVDLIGTRRTMEQHGEAQHGIHHIDLSCNEWKVELKSLPSTSDNMKALNAEGGYKLTHIGSFDKANGSSFIGEIANSYLKTLRFFLSFAKGGWCEPICAVGFDEHGSRVWESWSSPREPWHNPLVWFDPHNSIQLVDLFPCFMVRWEDENWRKALYEIIYWYLNANHTSRGIIPGIILTQAAIERLSYEYSVKYKRLLTVNGFKNLWASDKFRMLFSSLGIPLEIPKSTPEMEKLAKNFNWIDAPHALTEIRNSLVHPENKKRDQLNLAYYEAWNLGLWYLEMGILALCGYNGDYTNRLKQKWNGQIEKVPWGKSCMVSDC